MRRPVRSAIAVAAMVALSSSSAVGWSAALHAATDHHHDDDSRGQEGALGLLMVLHGHAHTEATRAHSHPLAWNVATLVSGKLLVCAGAMIGDVPEVVCGEVSGCRLPAQRGPTHDPPARAAFSVLRI